jgi:dipeptidyl aminopeptidase/acylaminoacyl peptidase
MVAGQPVAGVSKQPRTLAGKRGPWSGRPTRIAVLVSQDVNSGKEKNSLEVVGMPQENCAFSWVPCRRGRAELHYPSDRPISSIAVSPKGDEVAFTDQPNWREPEGRFHSVVKRVGIESKQVRDAFTRNTEWFDDYVRGGKKPGWFAPQLR